MTDRSSRHPPYVAVVGSGGADADVTAARAVGRAVAEGGAVLVCGGLGGTMAAAAAGAREAGGLTVGLLPREDRSEANPHLTVAIPTGLGELRNGLVVRAADVVVALPGGFGTLSEIAFALRIGVPVVVLGDHELDPNVAAASHRALDAREAVSRALDLLGRGQ